MNALNLAGRIATAAVALTAAVVFANTVAQAHRTKVASATPTPVSAARGPSEEVIAEIRQAAERYRDIKVALAEGFITDPASTCETAEKMGYPKELGAMGIHYFRPDLLGITGVDPRVDGVGTHTDYTTPAILLYEPQADGSLELVGVENLVFRKAWLANNSEPPNFAGVPFDHMADDSSTEIDEAHGFEPHFDLHVWLYQDNPNGMFAQFNPNVSCDFERTQQAAN